MFFGVYGLSADFLAKEGQPLSYSQVDLHLDHNFDNHDFDHHAFDHRAFDHHAFDHHAFDHHAHQDDHLDHLIF